MKSILITGGCGFVGSNLSNTLLAKGHKVSILDNLSTGSLNNLISLDSIKIYKEDIRNDKIEGIFQEGFDLVIHLAAAGSVVDSVKDPNHNFSSNVIGTFNVLKAAQKASIKQVIFSSTGGALIGDATPPVNENSIPRPISPYGASKLACEGYCSAFAASYDMSITALRFANVIGPISWHKKGAVTAFFKSILNEKQITIYGDGSATRDFLYVEDLCDGINAAVEAELPNLNILHLASGREVSVKELAKIAKKVAGKPDHPIEFKETRKGEVNRNFAEFHKASKILGFNPKTSLENAMQKTWNWFYEYSKLH